MEQLGTPGPENPRDLTEITRCRYAQQVVTMTTGPVETFIHRIRESPTGTFIQAIDGRHPQCPVLLQTCAAYALLGLDFLSSRYRDPGIELLVHLAARDKPREALKQLGLVEAEGTRPVRFILLSPSPMENPGSVLAQLTLDLDRNRQMEEGENHVCDDDCLEKLERAALMQLDR